jgi:hypothetical protein
MFFEKQRATLDQVITEILSATPFPNSTLLAKAIAEKNEQAIAVAEYVSKSINGHVVKTSYNNLTYVVYHISHILPSFKMDDMDHTYSSYYKEHYGINVLEEALVHASHTTKKRIKQKWGTEKLSGVKWELKDDVSLNISI